MKKEGLDWLFENESLTKPVYASLVKINEKIPIKSIEGSCGKHSSFSVFIVQLTTGEIFCRAKTIHDFANSLL